MRLFNESSKFNDVKDAVIGDWNEYFHLSNLVEYRKKDWVPYWLWRLVSDVRLVGEPWR